MLGKRGQEHPLYMIMFELVILLFFGGAMTAYAANVAADTTFWKLYFINDLSTLTTLASASPGDLVINYPYVSAMPLKTTLVVELATDNVESRYQEYSVKVSDTGGEKTPSFKGYARNTLLKLKPSKLVDSGSFQIVKKHVKIDNKEYDLTFLPMDEALETTCPSLQNLYDPATVSFSFQSMSPALQTLVDTSPESIPSKLERRLSLFNIPRNRFESDPADVNILFFSADVPQMTIYFSQAKYPQGDFIACTLNAEMEKDMPELVSQAPEILAIEGAPFSDPTISSFFKKQGLDILVTIPSAKITPEMLSSFSDLFSETLYAAVNTKIDKTTGASP